MRDAVLAIEEAGWISRGLALSDEWYSLSERGVHCSARFRRFEGGKGRGGKHCEECIAQDWSWGLTLPCCCEVMRGLFAMERVVGAGREMCGVIVKMLWAE